MDRLEQFAIDHKRDQLQSNAQIQLLREDMAAVRANQGDMNRNLERVLQKLDRMAGK